MDQGSKTGYDSEDSDFQGLCIHLDSLADVKDTSEEISNISSSTLAGPTCTTAGKDESSINEFEQIERLIQENTVVDSDAEENDSPTPDATKEQDAASFYHDTGYQSANGNNYAQSTNDPQTTGNRNDYASPKANEQNSFDQELNFRPHDSVEHTIANRDETDWKEDFEEDDEKLAATFGTTENLEYFLKQQLEESERNLSEQEKNENKDPVVRIKEKARKIRKTRSPAANRVKKANRRPRSRIQSSARESSDELSVRSDVSRTELRQRLRNEHKGRKKEKEVVNQLQSDYDDLLTRYAEAENNIDQLRIGAKIDLFAQLPNYQEEYPPNNGNDGYRDQLDNRTDGGISGRSKLASLSSRSRHSLQDMDSLTESSLKLPSVANVKFFRLAFENQAAELKEQMESFKTLLNGNHVAADEKKHFLENIEESLRALERDFIAAKSQDQSLNHSSFHNPSFIKAENFDPNHELEGEIYRLGKMLENLKNETMTGFISSPGSLPSHSAYMMGQSDSSSESDLDAGFNDLLQRYNKSALAGHDEASSSSDRSSIGESEDESNVVVKDLITSTSATKMSETDMPERFLRPLSSRSASPTSSRTLKKHTSDRSPENQKRTSSPQRPRSRLPRPVSHSTPAIPKTASTNRGMEVDSGYMGSESSRQSFPKTHPGRKIFSGPATEFKIGPLQENLRLDRRPSVRTSPTRKNSFGHSTEFNKKPVDKNVGPGTGSHTPRQIKTLKSRPNQDGNLEEQFRRMSFSSPNTQRNEQDEMEHAKMSDKSKIYPNGDHAVHQGTQHEQPMISGIRSGSSSSPLFSIKQNKKHKHKWNEENPMVGAGDNRSRSASSSPGDSTLGLLCDEIAKLREEISQREITKAKKKSSKTQTNKSVVSDSCLSESNEQLEETKKTEKQPVPVRSISPSEIKKSRFGKTKDAKVGADSPFSVTSPQPHNNMQQTGHWIYVHPNVSNSVPAAPASHTVFKQGSPSAFLPLITPVNGVYLPHTNFSSYARVYVPAHSVSTNVLQEANRYEIVQRRPATHNRRRSGRWIENENIDENDYPLTRSQLISTHSSPAPRRTTYFDPQLNLSLRRAEKAADGLRSKSRSMYRSIRDSLRMDTDLSSTI